MPDYRVEVYERASFTDAGVVDEFVSERLSETSATNWQHCLSIARTLAKAHPTCIVCAYDAQAYVVGETDGLTDAQRDEVLRSIEEARRGR